jgi:hypothetical protein
VNLASLLKLHNLARRIKVVKKQSAYYTSKMLENNLGTKNILPAETPTESEYVSLWTSDPALQEKILKARTYIDKLALIGNHSRLGPNALKTIEDDFSGPKNILDVSTGATHGSGLFESYAQEVRRTKLLSDSFEGVNSGTALEMVFVDMVHVIFDGLFDVEITSNFDNVKRGVDAVLMLKPFEKTRFLFGMDFTIWKTNVWNTKYGLPSTDKLDEKFTRLVNFVGQQNSFSIRFIQDHTTEERLTAVHVPKVISFLHPNMFEQLAEHYYKMEHEKVLEILEEIKRDIVYMIYAECVVLKKYAKKLQNPDMLASYSFLLEAIRPLVRKLVPIDKQKWITLTESPVVGDLAKVVRSKNFKES